MQIVWSFLSILKKKLIISIPVFMVLGLLYGVLFEVDKLKILIIPFTFLMVYPMMVTLKLRELLKRWDLKVQIIAQILNFLVIPFIALGLGKIFFSSEPKIAVGLFLAALLPTSGMTISWTGFARGNMHAAIKMTIVGLILGAIATPFYLQYFMGTVVSVPLKAIFKQIAIIVFLPMLTGYLTKRVLIKVYGNKKYQEDIGPKFPILSTLGVLGIVFVAMALKANSIFSNPALLLKLILPLIVFYLINFTLSTLVAKLFFSRDNSIALLYGTVMRNLSIALAIAMLVFGEEGSEIALIIALAYIIQVQSAAWYVKFTDRIFGVRDVEHMG